MREPTLPIVRLEVEGFRMAIQSALLDRKMQLDTDIQAAVDAACTPENVRRVLSEQVHLQVTEALKDAVKHWFLHTEDGQGVVKEEVARYLKDYYIMPKKQKKDSDQ